MVNDSSLFLSFIGGTLLPLLISFILSQSAPSWVRATVAMIVCIIFTALSMWLTNKFIGPTPGMSTNDTLKLWVENLGVVLMAAWSTFQFFWKQINVSSALETAVFSPKIGATQPDPPPTS